MKHLPSIEIHVQKLINIATTTKRKGKVHHLHPRCPCVIAAWHGAKEPMAAGSVL